MWRLLFTHTWKELAWTLLRDAAVVNPLGLTLGNVHIDTFDLTICIHGDTLILLSGDVPNVDALCHTLGSCCSYGRICSHSTDMFPMCTQLISHFGKFPCRHIWSNHPYKLSMATHWSHSPEMFSMWMHFVSLSEVVAHVDTFALILRKCWPCGHNCCHIAFYECSWHATIIFSSVIFIFVV